MRGGIGFYERLTTVTTEYINDHVDGSFVGERDEAKVRASGFGYHAGMGTEIAIAYNFFFTSNYTHYSYLLKSVEVFGNADDRYSKETTKEVSFGLSYYYK